ncbi:hypothetical protein KUCAC02_007310, partial [Chaenocephalus aceratus]
FKEGRVAPLLSPALIPMGSGRAKPRVKSPTLFSLALSSSSSDSRWRCVKLRAAVHPHNCGENVKRKIPSSYQRNTECTRQVVPRIPKPFPCQGF